MVDPTGRQVQVVGVDPGATWTGVVALSAEAEVCDQVVLQRRGGNWNAYRLLVLATLGSFEPEVVAVESVRTPSPYIGNRRRVISPRPAIETARVWGWVEAWGVTTGRRVVVVPPARHGQRPLDDYPGSLVGRNETAGTGRLRHLRSAYDIALAATGTLPGLRA
jgi:hypothetical protein